MNAKGNAVKIAFIILNIIAFNGCWLLLMHMANNGSFLLGAFIVSSVILMRGLISFHWSFGTRKKKWLSILLSLSIPGLIFDWALLYFQAYRFVHLELLASYVWFILIWFLYGTFISDYIMALHCLGKYLLPLMYCAFLGCYAAAILGFNIVALYPSLWMLPLIAFFHAAYQTFLFIRLKSYCQQ